MKLGKAIKTVILIGALGIVVDSQSSTIANAMGYVKEEVTNKNIVVSDTYKKQEVTLNQMIESGELDQYIETKFKLYEEAADKEKMQIQKEQLHKFEKSIENKLQRASHLTFNENTIYATLPFSLDGKNSKVIGNNFNISYGINLSKTDAIINEEEMSCTLVIPISAVGLYNCTADANFERVVEDVSWWFKNGWGHYEKSLELQEEATHQLMLTATQDASQVTFEELRLDAELALKENILASAVAMIDSGLADCSLYIQWVDDQSSAQTSFDRILVAQSTK